jgi:hypothetical protein
MFFLFALLVLVNAVADNEKVILQYRYEVAGLPINMLDFGLALMLIVAIATMSRPKYQADRTHRVLFWTIGFLVFSLAFGVFGALKNNVELRYWVTVSRNVLMLPLCIFLGYHVVRTPRHALWASYVMILASVASGIFVLLFVRETGEVLSTFDKLRKTSYGGDAGLLGMCFLAFAVVSRLRFLPTILSVLLILFSAVCFFSLPHRSNWVMAVLTLLFSLLVLPRVTFGRKLGYSLFLGAAMGVTMLAAIGAYSQLTGRNFQEYIEQRINSLMPWAVEEAGNKDVKAWETRIPGAVREFQMWTESPLTGKGFGIQMEEEESRLSEGAGGFNHNVWTASLAQSGVWGLLGYILPSISSMLIGFRLVRESNDKGLLYMGAMGAILGCATFFYSFMTMSINTQRQAIHLGLICGMVYRCRAIQLTMAREYAGYLDPGELPLEGWADDTLGLASAEGY